MEKAKILFTEQRLAPCRGRAELSEVLRGREARVRRREALVEEGFPLVTLGLNIPGPVKRNGLYDAFFLQAEARFRAEVLFAGGCVRKEEISATAAGAHALFQIEGLSPEALKTLATALEETGEAGRLLDLDVFDLEGKKLSRAGERRCLVCGGPAFACARSRAHSLESLTEEVSRRMRSAMLRRYGDFLKESAVKSALREVSCGPKPGLVDRLNSGAHADMDLQLFLDSSLALGDFLEDTLALLYKILEENPVPGNERELLLALKQEGMRAERRMFFETGGVNTQMGLLYAYQILFAGALFSYSKALLEGLSSPETVRPPSLERLCERGAEIARGIAEADGICELKGARRSAAEGYCFLREETLPVLCGEGTAEERSLRALLLLMARLEDENLLRRGGEAGLSFVQEEAERLLRGGFDREALLSFDQSLREKNLSPGGAADLLALSWFLFFLAGPGPV